MAPPGTPPPPWPRTDGMAPALARLGEALDSVLSRPPGTRDAVDAREVWTAALTGPLPETGAGAETTLEELATVVVPHGTRLADPILTNAAL